MDISLTEREIENCELANRNKRAVTGLRSSPEVSFVNQTKMFFRAKIKRRTSGPLNTHLTLGPGIYFNAFIHVYSPGTRAENLLGTNF